MDPEKDSVLPKRASAPQNETPRIDIPTLGLGVSVLGSSFSKLVTASSTDKLGFGDPDNAEDLEFAAESPTAPWIVSGRTARL